MSRVDDLKDLIRTANEIYLINPQRNARTAFIQIDDLCELAMKSWLQIDTTERQKCCINDLNTYNLLTSNNHRRRFQSFLGRDSDLTQIYSSLGINTDTLKQATLKNVLALHTATVPTGYSYSSSYEGILNWSADKDDGSGFKSFTQLVEETKARHTPSSLHDLLDRVIARRDNRNRFFHDQNFSGLTVINDNCLAAFCDLYNLMDILFDNALSQNETPSLRVQVAVIRARQRIEDNYSESAKYQNILKKWSNGLTPGGRRTSGEVCIQHGTPLYEYALMLYDAEGFYNTLKQNGFAS